MPRLVASSPPGATLTGRAERNTFWNSFRRDLSIARLQSVPAFFRGPATAGPRSFGKVASILDKPLRAEDKTALASASCALAPSLCVGKLLSGPSSAWLAFLFIRGTICPILPRRQSCPNSSSLLSKASCPSSFSWKLLRLFSSSVGLPSYSSEQDGELGFSQKLSSSSSQYYSGSNTESILLYHSASLSRTSSLL